MQFARKVGDEQIPRPWSKHSEGSTAHKRLGAAAVAAPAAPPQPAGAAAKGGKRAGKAGSSPAPGTGTSWACAGCEAVGPGSLSILLPAAHTSQAASESLRYTLMPCLPSDATRVHHLPVRPTRMHTDA